MFFYNGQWSQEFFSKEWSDKKVEESTPTPNIKLAILTLVV